MPYIKQADREKYDKVIDCLPHIESKGDLEYIVYKLAILFMRTRTSRYSNLHDCVYSIIHAGEEFKRRNLDTRENEAIMENGDIV